MSISRSINTEEDMVPVVYFSLPVNQGFHGYSYDFYDPSGITFPVTKPHVQYSTLDNDKALGNSLTCGFC